jgi:hypothetical protein
VVGLICFFFAVVCDVASDPALKAHRAGTTLTVAQVAAQADLRPVELKPHVPHDANEASLLEMQTCGGCGIDVCAGSKHCRVCDRCTGHFDHHCRYLNNCIGAHNYRWFITYLGVCIVAAATCVTVAARAVLVSSNPAVQGGAVLVGLVAGGMGVLVVSLAWFHCRLGLRGETTYEVILRRRAERDGLVDPVRYRRARASRCCGLTGGRRSRRVGALQGGGV